MFNLTPGATLGFTDRMKFSRLFVHEEGVCCVSIRSPTSRQQLCPAFAYLSFCRAMLRVIVWSQL